MSITLTTNQSINLTTGVVTDSDTLPIDSRLPGHAEGLRMNDPITLASAFRTLAGQGQPWTVNDGIRYRKAQRQS